MTFISKFESLKKKIKNVNEDVLNEEFAIQVTMNDDDCGGTFYIANIDKKFAVEPYNYYDNTVAVVCAAKTFSDIIGGRKSLEKAEADGKIEIYGNREHAKILSVIVKKEPKKATVKKVLANKSEDKVKKSAKTKKADAKASSAKEKDTLKTKKVK